MAMALEGLRVIDQTQVMAGPFCSMLPAAMGADVIKVEPRRASTPAGPSCPPPRGLLGPLIGEHAADILTEPGYQESEQRDLRNWAIIQ